MCNHNFIVHDSQGVNRFLCKECNERFVDHPLTTSEPKIITQSSASPVCSGLAPQIGDTVSIYNSTGGIGYSTVVADVNLSDNQGNYFIQVISLGPTDGRRMNIPHASLRYHPEQGRKGRWEYYDMQS